MKEYLNILELAAKGNLPKKIDETSEISVNTVKELIEAGYLSAIDTSSLDGISYLNTRITLIGRKYLSDQEAQDKENFLEISENRIRLFISHSSKDSDLVQLIIELLQSALHLSASNIRCTSIDGYRLPGGADTDKELRQEVHEADAFIGVISSHSINSLYVAFELGARWGINRPLIPLITPGSDPKILSGPLKGINALNAGNRSQLHQLISDLSRELYLKYDSPAAYEGKIDAILKMESSSPSQEFRTLFGIDINKQEGIHLVYAQLALSQQQNEKGEPIRYPFVKPGEENTGVAFSIERPVSSSELRSAKYLSDVMGREIKQSPLLSSDYEVQDKYNFSFISFGGPSSNFKSRDALTNDGNILLNFVDNTFITCRTQRKVIELQPGLDYGLILKLHPSQFPEKTWIICAGIGEWGTSGATWFLAYKWREIYIFAKGDPFAIIVKVREKKDESSEAVVKIKSPDDAERFADTIRK